MVPFQRFQGAMTFCALSRLRPLANWSLPFVERAHQERVLYPLYDPYHRSAHWYMQGIFSDAVVGNVSEKETSARRLQICGRHATCHSSYFRT